MTVVQNKFTTAARTDLRHRLERLEKTVFKWQKTAIQSQRNKTFTEQCVKRKNI